MQKKDILNGLNEAVKVTLTLVYSYKIHVNPVNTTGNNRHLMNVIVQHQGLQTAQVKCIALKTVVPFLLKPKS